MIHLNIIQELERKAKKAQEDYLKFLRDSGYVFTVQDVYGDGQCLEYWATHSDYKERGLRGDYINHLNPEKYPEGAVIQIMFPITEDGYLDLT